MKLQRNFRSYVELLITLPTFAWSHTPPVSFEKADYATADVIVRDVLVVGGGATGTYAAVRLQQDFNKSVAVVEQKPVLGGHTSTYHDTATNTTIDMGVIVFHDLPLVRAFFNRFDIPLTTLSFTAARVKNVDFRTGQPIDIPSNPNDTAAAFSKWADQLARYPTLNEGFVLPDPVPEDLLLPFGQFVQKYNLSAIASSVWSFGQGYGDILNSPTLYALKLFGPDILRGIPAGFITTLHRNNHQLYEKALQLLGNNENVFLNSSIRAMARNRGGEYGAVVLSMPSGYKLVQAKQFLFTIPPIIDHLHAFDLDKKEEEIFSQFRGCGYYTALLQDAPVPDNTTISNHAGNPAKYYLPRLP